ncbi:MAG: hypothetical protein IT427_02405 [Pirellulales bacterium]|nr:hypothetical protein [Pirellulales bacterium]
MSANSSSGFLVVLADSGYRNALNPKYMGVDRVPPYYTAGQANPYPEETAVLDDYVFGDYKDEKSNLIIDYSKALELWQRFKISRRPYEILLCCFGLDDATLANVEASNATIVSLGYDVAGISGDGWSIVEDIPSGEWAKVYSQALNENGLFKTRMEAERYHKEYRDHQEADWDCPFEVVFVVRIIPEGQ